jgi:hypothetical protein
MSDYTISVYIRPAASQKASADCGQDGRRLLNHWALQFDAPMELWVPSDRELGDSHHMADMARDRWYHVAVVRRGK